MDIINTQFKVRKKRLRLLTIGGGLLLAGLVVIGATQIGPAQPSVDASNLWIGSVQRGQMLREVRATGTLVPREIRWLAASTPAQVEKIVILAGTRVHPDTVLMTLSNPEVEDSLRNAQASVAAAQADVAAKRSELQSQLLDERSILAQAESDYAVAKVKADADAKAVKLNVIPQVQFQQSMIVLKQLKLRAGIEQQRVDSFVQNMKAQMDAVNAHLLQQRSNLTLRQRQADALNVRAGVDGVLQEVAVQEGARVEAGANLARVARPDVLLARLQVPEAQSKDIALGMPVTVDTHNGTVAGKVERIDPAVRDGSVQIDVDLAGKLPPGARPDLSVDGTIRIAQLDDVLSVGRPAQVQAQSDVTLFRVDPSGDTASRVPVHIGAASVDRVQIDRGLGEGDRVILSDTSQWDKYDRIRIR
jgi:RND family efflux transporter MFP subunit